MFELPEYTTLARQMNETLSGRVIQQGNLGNSPHKFVWYNRTHEEFERLTRGKQIGEACVKGRWLTLDLDPGYRLLLGECGGKVLFHPSGSTLPGKYHLLLKFEDGTLLTVLTAMWGAMELYEAGQELERKYIKGMHPTPVDPEFTFDYFSSLLEQLVAGENRSVKSLLTQDQLIPGLGNAIAQDILFTARLHPRQPLAVLSASQLKMLYKAIVDTVGEVISKNGRSDETDLHGNPGGYVRIMDSHATGKPCPRCASPVDKIQYLGGSCYLCTSCQVMPTRVRSSSRDAVV